MDYVAIREWPRQFVALTSLHVAEFDDLLTDFAPAWVQYQRWHTLDGAKRRLPAHGERANTALAGSDVKLFFLLTYLKSTALQEHQAASFGVSQTRVSRLTTALLGVLNQVLQRRGLRPVRDGAELARHLARHPDKVFAYDGVERGVPRNQNRNGQAEEYSAKKSPPPQKHDLVRRHAVRALPLAHGRRARARQENGR
ncbi:transposase family protein [Hymenobacter sp. B81]|uniref:transposase family protein n=1 Tax=Hymenobacter sp. B81 TaxID=3344878 RepID=UPI0037DC0512